MNWIGLITIYKKEMARTFRVPGQTLISPVLTTALYFVVFGSAVGRAIPELGGVSYELYIVPGLIMMALLTNALTAASSGIYFPKFIGTKYEFLSAPLSYFEIIAGHACAAATRALIIAAIIYCVSLYFTGIVPLEHPFLAAFFAIITALAFSLFGLVIGIWADSFEKLSLFPTLIITPLSFLGGIFYSIDMLPGIWQKISLINPIVYMISGLRWSFFGVSDVDPVISFSMITLFTVACAILLTWMFRTGYRIKN